jgi:CRP/FNR family transcriptional regulator, cyclic AMP receptor protein
VTVSGFLSDLEIFSHFSGPRLDKLASYLSWQRFGDGEHILRYDQPGTDAYLIQQGLVRIERTTPYGSYPLAALYPGSIFGETSFIDGGPRTTDAVADGEVEVLILSLATLERAAAEDPGFEVAVYWTFWKSLSSKLRSTNARLTEFFGKAGRPGADAPRPRTGKALEHRVELTDKRRLFEEQRLSNMEIHFLASLSKEERFAAGEVIFHEGDPGDKLYVVLEGKVRISKSIPGAGEEALAFLERGAYFGEMALIDQLPRSADARAHTGGAVVLAIPRDVLQGILDIRKLSSPRLLKILCGLIAARLRELDDKIVGWYILSGGQGLSEGLPPVS